jgi:hypothetical protein
MRSNAKGWIALITGVIMILVSVQYSEAQSLPSPLPVRWPEEGVMATLTQRFTRPSQGGLEFHSDVTFADIPTRFSPPGTTVTFPFRAILEDDSTCEARWGFIITVRRRGSAWLGIPGDLEILGHKGVIGRSTDFLTGAIREFSRRITLTIPPEVQGDCRPSRGPLRHAEETFDVTVTLPGGVNFVEIVAETEGGNDRLEVRKEFPSTACARPGVDSECMLIAVAPTAIVIPDVVPLTILYEPPGNCSYAMIKQSHSAGVQMALTEAGAENRKVLIDTKAAITKDPITQSNTEQHQVNSFGRISRFEFSDGEEWSTAIAEEKVCESYREHPERHGPGLGDMLIFLTHPQFFYWDTAGLSNYRYPVSPTNGVPPGQPEPLPQFAYAWQLRNFLDTLDERWLPKWLRGATRSEIRELARLDPFIRLPSRPPRGNSPELPRAVPKARDCRSLDPQDFASAVCVRDALKDTELDTQRFVKIGATCIPTKKTHLSDVVAETNNLSASSISKISEEEPGKTTLQSVIEGVAFVGGAAAKAAGIQGITPELIEEGLNAVTRGYTDESVITMTATMTRNEGIKTVEGNQYTQTLRFFDEEDPHACAAFYYDKIFGTIATKKLPGGAGVFRQAAQGSLSTKDQLIETAAIIAGREGTVPLSRGNLDLLTSQTDGALSFELAYDEEYEAAEGTKQGLPGGLALDPSTGDLLGAAMVDSEEVFQALVVVRDASGADVASLWMNLRVVPEEVVNEQPVPPPDPPPDIVSCSCECANNSTTELIPSRATTRETCRDGEGCTGNIEVIAGITQNCTILQ